MAEILWEALLTGNIVGKTVIDLGCGTGRFAIAAAILGAKHVICLDIDHSALDIAKKCALEMKVDDIIDFVRAWVPHVHFINVDTVIQNPPFGVWRKHADLIFLTTAFDLKPKTIYSIHKANPRSRKVIMREAENRNYGTKIISRKRFLIPPFMKHHYKRKHYVLIEIFKFELKDKI